MILTVSEFRKDMRKAFEAAANGETVKIKRYDKVFIILQSTPKPSR